MMVAYGPGDVKFNQAPIGRPFPSGWVDCGSLLLDQPEIIGAVPLVKLDRLKEAIGKHVVRLIAQGWGGAPRDVLDWFNPFCPFKAFVQTTYCVVGGAGNFGLVDKWSGLGVEVLGCSGEGVEVEWRTSLNCVDLNSSCILNKKQALELFMSSVPAG
jgi:hypothetical protein